MDGESKPAGKEPEATAGAGPEPEVPAAEVAAPDRPPVGAPASGPPAASDHVPVVAIEEPAESAPAPAELASTAAEPASAAGEAPVLPGLEPEVADETETPAAVDVVAEPERADRFIEDLAPASENPVRLVYHGEGVVSCEEILFGPGEAVEVDAETAARILLNPAFTRAENENG